MYVTRHRNFYEYLGPSVTVGLTYNELTNINYKT